MFKQVRFLLSNCRSHEFSSQIYSAKMDAAEISAIFFHNRDLFGTWLCERLRTRSDLQRSKPSGTSVSLLCDRSKHRSTISDKTKYYYQVSRNHTLHNQVLDGGARSGRSTARGTP
jgi:hypothetical protein